MNNNNNWIVYQIITNLLNSIDKQTFIVVSRAKRKKNEGKCIVPTISCHRFDQKHLQIKRMKLNMFIFDRQECREWTRPEFKVHQINSIQFKLGLHCAQVLCCVRYSIFGVWLKCFTSRSFRKYYMVKRSILVQVASWQCW